MTRKLPAWIVAGLVLIAFHAAQAQQATPSAVGTADSAAARVSPYRAAWIADPRPLRVGDLLTVYLDEQTAARERVSRTASAARGQKGTLSAGFDGKSTIGPSSFQTGMDGNSRDVGEANRYGDLSGVITVRVQSVGPGGLAQVSGSRKITIDGREQQATLTGLVRPEDVGATNVIYSSRIADAQIAYTGNKLSPRGGFLGRILSMLWP